MKITAYDRNELVKQIKKTISENWLSVSLRDFSIDFMTWVESLDADQVSEIEDTEDEYGNQFNLSHESDSVEYFYRFVSDGYTGNVGAFEAHQDESDKFMEEQKIKAYRSAGLV